MTSAKKIQQEIERKQREIDKLIKETAYLYIAAIALQRNKKV